MQPFYIVDGSGYIFRAFYAVAPLNNSKGLPSNALLGFTRMLAKLIKEVDAKYLAVTFDCKEPTFRHEMYPLYKANRAECPAELVPQLPYFRKIVEAFGLKSLEKPGVEADDIIATLARKFANDNKEVIIVSGDKDLLQLVDENILVYDAMKDQNYKPEDVRNKFGVWPKQVLDYLALIGDSSDNVPGVKGIGPKTAEQLISHFGSINELVSRIDEIISIPGLRGAKGVKDKIEQNIENLSLSLKLISLKYDVEPYISTSQLADFEFKEFNFDLLEELFKELEFNSLLNTLKGQSKPKSNVDIYSNKNFQLINKDNFATFIQRLDGIPEFAIDTETTSLDVYNCELCGISISWQENEAYYLTLLEEKGIGLEDLITHLGPILSNANIKKVGQNIKYDINVLKNKGFVVEGVVFDSMLCSHLLHPDKRQNGLKVLAQNILNEKMTTYEEMLGEHKSIKEVPQELLAKYASHDADCSWQLYKQMLPMLGQDINKPSLRYVFDNIEVPLISVLSTMELNGIKVDLSFLENLGVEFTNELSILEKNIYELAGVEFNINSPKQLSAILFDKLALPTAGVRKNQTAYSTDSSVLELLSKIHPIADKLLEYRELFKLNSTYVEAIKRLINQDTHRIHTSFNQAIAATGRLSSTEPNLQNIPIKNPRGRKIREAFVAEEGYTLLSADYSQIELRILAHLSNDENLRDSFLQDQDIHQKTADEIFGAQISSPEERRELRRVAKTINFGVIYGISAFRLANQLSVSRKQAQEYIDQYFARYPKVKTYFSQLKEQIASKGYTETIFGRRRFAQEIDTSGRDAGYAERSLINAPIQGSAAEIIKLSMIVLDEKIKQYQGDVRMVLQVHDELVFEVRNSLLDRLKVVVVEEMQNAVQLNVPLKVDINCGRSWNK